MGRLSPRGLSIGPLQLLDEAVSIFQSDPLRWMLVAWKPVLPLALIMLVFLHCHRVLWLDQSWGMSTQLNSLAMSAVVLVALLVRTLGHALNFGEVVGVAHPRALSHLEEHRGAASFWQIRLSLAWSALLVIGPGLVLGTLGLLPGMMVVAFMVPVTGVIALEGRTLSEALLRRLQFSPGVFLRGLTTTAVLTLVVLLCWVNLVVGAQLLVALLRMMSGLDVGVLAVWFSPFNVDFLIYTLGLSFLLLEPLWLILRALLYLDAHLSQSGMDLLERLQELDLGADRDTSPTSSGRAPIVGVLLALAVSLSVFSVPAMAAEPVTLEWPQAGDGVLPALQFAESLELKADAVDERVEAFEEVGNANLGALRLVLLDGSATYLQIGKDVPIEIDLGVLSSGLPEILHTEAQAQRLRVLSERLQESARFIRDVEEGGNGSLAGGKEGLAAAALLEDELSEGGYRLSAVGEGGRLYREGVWERLSRWWTAWTESLQTAPSAETRELELPEISPLVFALMALLLGVLLLAVLFRSIRGGRDIGKSGIGSATSARRQAGDVLVQPAELRRRALKLAEQHLYEEATRALFLATLLELDRGREIDLRPELSNGEHLRAFAGTAERRTAFGLAIRRFESHCYGTSECGRVEFQQMLDIVGGLVSSSTEHLETSLRGPGSSG